MNALAAYFKSVSESMYSFISSPVQITPLPVYPELHAQAKLPGMFVQVAVPTAQLLEPVEHSSMSENRKNS